MYGASPASGIAGTNEARLVGNPELRAKVEAATPLHVIGDADDIAAMVVHLASSAGDYVTGKVIEVDGGLQTPNLELGLPDL
jgi:7-alpha-hydroxysteroid dehydrogenase